MPGKYMKRINPDIGCQYICGTIPIVMKVKEHRDDIKIVP